MFPLIIETTKRPWIIGVTGPSLGSAKTWTISLLDYIMYRRGYTIYANHKLNFPHEDFFAVYNDIEKLAHIRRAVFSIDDANNLPGWESRRPSDPLNILTSNIAQGSRKMDRYMFFSAPKLIWIDIRTSWDLAVVHVYADHMKVNGVEKVKWDVLDKRYPVGDYRHRWDKWFNAEPAYKLFDTGELITPTMLSQRPQSNVPIEGKPIKAPVMSCPRCNTSSRLNYNRKLNLQYCSKCGWERVIKR